MINKRTKNTTNPMLRLAMRLMRQQGFSFPQIAGATGTGLSSIWRTCQGSTPESLRQLTLADLGLNDTPGSQPAYDALLAETAAWLAQRLELLGEGAPRGWGDRRRAA